MLSATWFKIAKPVALIEKECKSEASYAGEIEKWTETNKQNEKMLMGHAREHMQTQHIINTCKSDKKDLETVDGCFHNVQQSQKYTIPHTESQQRLNSVQ